MKYLAVGVTELVRTIERETLVQPTGRLCVHAGRQVVQKYMGQFVDGD